MSQYFLVSPNPLRPFNSSDGDKFIDPRNQGRDLTIQLLISVVSGLGAFLTFCIVRPRWPSLYYARKEHVRNTRIIPDLPPTMFGWIPVLWRVTDKEVIASAGLDAYAFLAFFKMAIRFLFVAAVLAAVVLTPIQMHYDKDGTLTSWELPEPGTILNTTNPKKPLEPPPGQGYLWTNVIFIYAFTILAFYFLRNQTQELIKHRQQYLGNQNSVTDRTIRLSGIPPELRNEEKLKKNLEDLQIGKVKDITICRNWRKLDSLVEERQAVLRKLEEAHTVQGLLFGIGLPVSSETADEEARPLLQSDGDDSSPRGPLLTVRHGWLNLRKRRVSAIDYFAKKLEDLDYKIQEARKDAYEATPLAFVTMDSVQSAQVMMQALLDPTPGCLIAHPAPQPADVLWANTYLSRRSRAIRMWLINTFITILSIIWLIPVATLAGLLNLDEIRKVWAGLADVLEDHKTVGSLVMTFLPTLVLTLLNVAVPYLYDWLSHYQGMISLADVELSVISKNFFFTFFNLFLAFTIFGTAFNFHTLWEALRDSFSDSTKIPYLLAKSLKDLAPFYINLIILQGIGIFPLRLLNLGSVALYPVARYGAKTPRDYKGILQPSTFKYSFYLPQPILVFIICIVYSVLPRGSIILTFGLVYFILGYFTYKYQLLYAMDHPRHSTGKSWTMIVHRVIVGLVVFQLAMAGFLALRKAFTRAALIGPLTIFTLWTIWHYNKHYKPANYFIALKSVQQAHGDPVHDAGETQTVDEAREEKQKFINPSFTDPLEGPMLHPTIDSGVGINGSSNDLQNGGE